MQTNQKNGFLPLLGLSFALATALVLLWPAAASASFALNLNQEFSGGTAPASSTLPWVTATLVDNNDGSVSLAISNPHLTGNENVSGFYLNFDDSLDVTKLTFSLSSSLGSFQTPTISLQKNAFKADGDGKYDILLGFATGGVASKVFGVGDSLTYRIGYTSAISATDFEFLSLRSGGHGPFYAAAHVQNTGAGGTGSGWISPTGVSAVPEPSTVLAGIGALALLVLGTGRHSRRSANKQTVLTSNRSPVIGASPR